jgi:type IV pilus assembly protein PilM
MAFAKDNRLFFLPRRQPQPLLGLDISASSAKLVELSLNRAGRHVLERCAIELMQPGWIVDGRVERFEAVVAALQRLLRKARAQTVNVALALPAAAVIERKITLPGSLDGGLDPERLDARVHAEASQIIPFPLDDVYLDYTVLGPAAPPSSPSANAKPGAAAADGSRIEVLLVASRRERVQDLQGLAEAAGLEPVIVDVESYAAQRASARLVAEMAEDGLPPVSPASPVSADLPPAVAIFEFGTNVTTLQVLRHSGDGSDVIYERDLPFGGAALTQRIAERYGYSGNEAESRKRSGDLPADYEPSVHQPYVEQVVQGMGQALDFFYASTTVEIRHHRAQEVLLAGGAASLAGLPEAVTQQLDYACRLANPFEGMVAGRGLQTSLDALKDAPAYLTACGLALRRFMQ